MIWLMSVPNSLGACFPRAAYEQLVERGLIEEWPTTPTELRSALAEIQGAIDAHELGPECGASVTAIEVWLGQLDKDQLSNWPILLDVLPLEGPVQPRLTIVPVSEARLNACAAARQTTASEPRSDAVERAAVLKQKALARAKWIVGCKAARKLSAEDLAVRHQENCRIRNVRALHHLLQHPQWSDGLRALLTQSPESDRLKRIS